MNHCDGARSWPRWAVTLMTQTGKGLGTRLIRPLLDILNEAEIRHVVRHETDVCQLPLSSRAPRHHTDHSDHTKVTRNLLVIPALIKLANVHAAALLARSTRKAAEIVFSPQCSVRLR